MVQMYLRIAYLWKKLVTIKHFFLNFSGGSKCVTKWQFLRIWNSKTEKIPNVTSKFLSYVRTRLLNMTWSNLRFYVWRSIVTMATNLPSCFSIQFLEQLLKFLVNFTLLKYVTSQRSCGFLIAKELIFWRPYFGFKRSLLSLLNAHIIVYCLTREKNLSCLVFFA